MKRFVVMMMFLPCILMACTQKKAKKSTPISYQEPEWGMIDIESISDKDDWLHASEEQLDDTLARQLVDMYNYSVVWRNLYTDLDLSWRLWTNECNTEEFEYLRDAVLAMDCSMLMDTNMAHLADSLKQSVAQVIMDSAYLDYVYYFNRFMLPGLECYDRFLSECESEEDVDEPYALYVDNYDELKAMRMKNDSVHQEKLLAMIAAEEDINRKCVYAMEYAHSSDQGPNFDSAIPVLVEMMCMGEYSPILSDIWRTWRTMQAMQMGMSRDSAIPNLQYNALRRIVANTMINHIMEYPEDHMAIKMFTSLALCDNINRHCEYLFGNQNFEEMMITFADYFATILGE